MGKLDLYFAAMNIVIAVSSYHGDALQDPEYCENNPLGGSETAAVKMAQALRGLGHEVTLFTQPSYQLTSAVDVFISLRRWDFFNGDPLPSKLNYLWCQDDTDRDMVTGLSDPAVSARVCRNVDAVMLLSHYQAGRWKQEFRIPAHKLFLTSNGIDLPRFQVDPGQLWQRGPHAYYASTPWRGLDKLLDFWPMVYEATKGKARLSVCSSLQVYGGGDLPEFEVLYKRAKELNGKGVDYLGSVGQKQLREVAALSRALAYPCTFPETSCIAAMEAMASGCVVVGTSLGALPETAWRNPLFPIDETTAGAWIEELVRVLANDSYYELLARDNLRLAQLMGWNDVALRWAKRFHFDAVKRARALVGTSPKK
jgi:glycosyltransferase involved in cell wall biosynthesis